MSFSSKLGLSAVIISLLGVGVGAGIALSSSGTEPAVEAPSAVILERRELDSVREPGERAMVTTRSVPSAPSSPVLQGSHETSVREAERLPSPAIAREARERSVDGTRAAEGLRVRRLAVGTGIEGREPVGASERFDAEQERLYVFVELANRGDETQVEVSFEPESPTRDAHVTGLVDLEVPARVGRHRTWAWSRNVHAPGHWSAVVRDLEGRELARTRFVVE